MLQEITGYLAQWVTHCKNDTLACEIIINHVKISNISNNGCLIALPENLATETRKREKKNLVKTIFQLNKTSLLDKMAVLKTSKTCLEISEVIL